LSFYPETWLLPPEAYINEPRCTSDTAMGDEVILVVLLVAIIGCIALSGVWNESTVAATTIGSVSFAMCLVGVPLTLHFLAEHTTMKITGCLLLVCLPYLATSIGASQLAELKKGSASLSQPRADRGDFAKKIRSTLGILAVTGVAIWYLLTEEETGAFLFNIVWGVTLLEVLILAGEIAKMRSAARNKVAAKAKSY